MVRKAASVRLKELIAAATRTFIAKGYRRTRMDDVTRAMDLSPGAIYRYVESKEALFDLIIRGSASAGPDWDKVRIPLPTPKPGATLSFIRRTLEREGRCEVLEAALGRRSPRDVRAELEGLVRELFAKTARFRTSIKLLDAAALDWPELARLWSEQWRSNQVGRLATYLDRRISQRLLRPVPDTKAWARLIIESVAFLAMHRHYDPHPTPMDERTAEETVVSAVVRALTKEEQPDRRKKRQGAVRTAVVTTGDENGGNARS
jgi:AcrR family transcriptional regulator